MKRKQIKIRFTLRAGVCYFLILLLFLFSALRVLAIDLKDYEELQKNQSTLKIPICSIRGTILDKNGIPLTNSKMQIIAAINPTKQAINAVKNTLPQSEANAVLSLLQNGKPAVCQLPYSIECEGITCTTVPIRITENTLAHHIVGYLDGSGNGADGIELAYNDLLNCKEPITADFCIDGRGRVLPGISPEFSASADRLSSAVWLTIDLNIQRKIEEISAPLKSGAVIVADCKTNKIRAMVSLPDFSPDDITASLNADNSPFINKALSSYNVGSIFKPCVAAAAIEEGLGDFTTDCTGSITIENRVFRCHKTSGHGSQNLTEAIKNSCNCYFYELAQKLNTNTLYKYAEYFSFGSRIKLCENLNTSAGYLPKVKELNSKSDKANFAIGQGEIMLSPVSMLCLYSAIANGGEYYLPSIVEKTTKDGKETVYDIKSKTTVINPETAEEIKEGLIKVVLEGTGENAKSEIVQSAGKTATAQTGRYDSNGEEITNSWFCGFFPFQNPQYTVIVMADGEYEKSPAEIFKEISEYLIK